MIRRFIGPFLVVATTYGVCGTDVPRHAHLATKTSLADEQSTLSIAARGLFSSPKTLLPDGSHPSSILPIPEFTVRGKMEDSSTTGWNEAEDTISIYQGGRLERQAIGRIGPSPEMRFYSYDDHGRMIQERILNHHVISGAGPFIYDLVSEYTYDDSGRVSQGLVAVGRGGVWYAFRRATYYYQNQNALQMVLWEAYDGTRWSPDSRTVYFNDSRGLPDSTIDEYWYSPGSQWITETKTEFTRPSADTVIVTDSGGSHVLVYVYNIQTGFLRFAEEYNSSGADGVWDITETSYSFDPDGVVRETDQTSYAQGAVVWRRRYESVRKPGPGIFLGLPLHTDRYFSTDTIAVWFVGSGVSSVSLRYSTDNGGSWTSFAAGLPDTGLSVYYWAPGAGLGSVKLRAEEGGAADVTDGTLTILPGCEFLAETTATVRCGVFSTGFIGADPQGYASGVQRTYPGFCYRGYPNALFSGGLILGQASGPLYGMMGSFSVRTLAPELPFSNFTSDGLFDQRTNCTISEALPNYPLRITQETMSRSVDDFVIFRYEVTNLMQVPLSQFYVGIFADWDISSLGFRANLGGIDSLRGLAYQYDPSTSEPNYYGVVALSGMSGAAVTSDPPDMRFLVSLQAGSGKIPGDLRTFIGSGPFSIAPGADQSVSFALVAGTSLASLQAHADNARSLSGTTAIRAPEDGQPGRFSLEQNYPNPFNPMTEIRYQVSGNSGVKLAVYDILGREVAVLVNERKAAGSYTVKFNASGLASGVYLCRLQAGSFVEAKKLLLVR